MVKAIQQLRDAGIHPTAQRVAVAERLRTMEGHPTADEVLHAVRQTYPTISRATVYNALALFADHGVVHKRTLREGTTVYDLRSEPHHHMIDEETGVIHDVPWDALHVVGVDELTDFDVLEYQVVIRGRLHRP